MSMRSQTSSPASAPGLHNATALTWGLTLLLALGAAALNRLFVPQANVGQLLDALTGAIALTTLFAVSEVLVIHIHVGTSAHTFSVVEVVVVLALIHSTPDMTLATIAIGTMVTLVGVRRQTPLKVAFNTASYAFGSQVAWTAFGLTPNATSTRPATWIAALVAIVCFASTGATFVWIVIGLRDRYNAKRLVEGLRIGLGAAVLATSSGVVAAILLDVAPLATPLAALPIAGAYLSNVIYARERRRAEELGFLQRSSETVLNEEVQSSALRGVIEQAVRELRLQYVEVELDEDGEIRRYTARNTGRDVVVESQLLFGPSIVEPAGNQPVLASLLRAVRESKEDSATLRRRGELGSDELGDAIRTRSLAAAVVVPIRVAERLIGVIALGDPATNIVTFGPEDVRVAETLASHIAMVVANGSLKRSIGDLRDLERQLVSELQYDSSTGLFNRSAFSRRTRELLEDDLSFLPPIALMLVDLDDFKRVNDTHGHAAGDALICEIGDRLRSELRPGDMAARLGGDEFAVLLTRVQTRDDAQTAAKRVTVALARPFHYQGVEIVTGASVGVALPKPGDDYSTLSERADVAMYRAKASGKGTFETIDPSTDEADLRAAELVRDLDRALERRELQLVFQPVVHLATREVASFESLIRWQHNSLGTLHPADFLRAGHDHSTLRQLDSFVVEQSLQALSVIGRTHPGRAISLNLSLAQLGNSRLLAMLARHQNTTAARLRLEVPARDLSRSIGATIEGLAELRAAGFDIVIDDVTLDLVPYATIAAVRPVQLKLSQSTTASLVDPAVAAVTRSLVGVGVELGFTVAVKGVETLEQEEHAISAGCSFGQGFLYSRPAELHQLKDTRAQLDR